MGIIAQQLAKNSDAPATPVPAQVPQVVTQQSRSKAQRFREIALLSIAQDKKHTTDEHKVTNTFVRLGKRVGMRLPSIATGMPSIDEYIIQCGGIPKGRIVEIFGPESAGKTSLALHIVGECQRSGGIVAFVDAEHALDPTYASKILGVDVDELVINQPDSGEEALANVDALLGLVDLIIIDSVSALVPQAELNGEMGDVHMGLQARLMSQAMRKLVGRASKTGTTLIFINQIREKIGVMFGSPETTSGGRALKFAASLRLDVRRITAKATAITAEDGDVSGHSIKVKAVKNKCGAPFRETFVTLMYDTGFDKIGNTIEYAVDKGVMEKSGAYYSFKDERVGAGMAKARAALRENPEWFAKVQAALTAALAAENTKADAKE